MELGYWFNLNTWSMYHFPIGYEKVYISKHSGVGIYVPKNGSFANCKDIVSASGAIFKVRSGAKFGCLN